MKFRKLLSAKEMACESILGNCARQMQQILLAAALLHVLLRGNKGKKRKRNEGKQSRARPKDAEKDEARSSRAA